jgi:hypothetical protein
MNSKSLTKEPCSDYHIMKLEVVPDLLVSVGKLDLWWIRRWLSGYNDHKVAAP